MAEQIDTASRSETTSLSRSDHPSQVHTRNNPQLTIDEVILSLAKAYENRRARQVFEWERSQTTNIRRNT